MSRHEKKTMAFSSEIQQKLDAWIRHYPPNARQSAVIPCLHILQEENKGYLTQELMDNLADYLDMPAISVYEVATFYSMFDLVPVGKHKINVCTNISCMLNGSESVVRHLEQRLGIALGQTTPDGKVTLREVECLGACCGAPMMQVDRDYHENLTPEKIDAILDRLT